MKRVISVFLALMMLVTAFPALADSNASKEMENVLLIVKSKVDVPEELSEFSGRVLGSSERVSYSFDWNNKDYSKSMSVYADSDGRITSYHYYSPVFSDKKLSPVSKKEIIDFAYGFLKKTLPEAFKDESDTLIYDEKSYNARGNLRYSLRFDRYKNSVAVKDNSAALTLSIEDDKVCVRNMSLSYDYDAEFEADEEIIENYIEKYKKTFPTELIYCDEYNYKKVSPYEPNSKPVLIYRIKDNNAGFISLANGEEIREDSRDSLSREENAVMDSMMSAGSSANKEILTEQEIAELSEIEGLLSVAELEKSIAALPYVKLDSSLRLATNTLAKNEYGEYIYRLHYNNADKKPYRYLNAAVNAQSGKIISLSQSYDATADEELTELQKKAAEDRINSFIKKVSPDEIKECEKTDSKAYSTILNNTYTRIVNGIKYIDNGIYISFDAKNNIVTSYRADFRNGDFADVKSAIGDSAAYEKILEYSPVTQFYILSGGKYVKAATLKKQYITVDAISGEVRNKDTSQENEFSYSDIDGHWVEDAATKLSEIQVGIAGDRLLPDTGVTQAEFLRLVCSGIIDKYYNSYTEEELYERLIADKIITEGEKAPEAVVKREDSFVYIIRIAGLERVAGLGDIYKIEYTDGSTLGEGKIGYAAILSGLGVVCGDGGLLRPADNLTRAEAIIMLYRYLLSL